MPLITADRVKETSNSTGTGNFILDGAATGYQSFNSAIGVGNTCYYCVEDLVAGAWEIGIGTLSNSTTLTRTTVLYSSNSNTTVGFLAGVKNVFSVYPTTPLANIGYIGNGVVTQNITGNILYPFWPQILIPAYKTQSTSLNRTDPTISNFVYNEQSAYQGITSFNQTNVQGYDTFSLINTGYLLNVSLPNATIVSNSLTISNAPLLTNLSVNSLYMVGNSITANTLSNITSINMPNISYVGGSLAFSTIPNLTSITMNNLSTVVGTLGFNSLNMMTNISLPNLSYAGSLPSTACPCLTSISLPNLVAAGGVSINTNVNLTLLSMPKLISVFGAFSINTLPSMTNITLGNLTTITGTFSPTTFVNATSINLPNLTTIIGGFQPNNFPNLVNMSFPNLSTVCGSFAPVTMVNLTTIDLPKMNFLGSFQPTGLPCLSTVNMPNLTFVNGAFGPTNLPLLNNINYPNLANVTGVFSPGTSLGNITDLTFNAMNYTGGFTANDLPFLTNMNFPNLTFCVGSFSPFTLTNLTSINFAKLSNITSAFSPSLGSVDLVFDNLTYIGGSFTPSSSAALNLPNLTTIGSTFQPTFSGMLTLSLPKLTTLLGQLFLTNSSNPFLRNVNLTSIVTLVGNINSDAANWTRFVFPNLITFGGLNHTSKFFDNIYMPNVTTCTGQLRCVRHSGMNFLSMPCLVTAGQINFIGLNTGGGEEFLDFPRLVNATQGININSYSAMRDISFDSLLSIGDAAYPFGVSGSANAGLGCLVTFSAPKLERIAGTFNFTSIPCLTLMNFPCLTFISAMSHDSLPCITNISYPSLQNGSGILSFNNLSNCTSANFPNLSNIVGAFSLTNIPKLTSMNFPCLSSVQNNFTPSILNNITNLTFPSMNITGCFTANGLPNLTLMNFPGLTTVNGVFAPTNMALANNISMPCLTRINSNFTPFNLNNITNLTFPSMNITGCFTANGLPNLTLMNFPCLTTVNGVFAVSNCSNGLTANASGLTLQMPCLSSITSNFSIFNIVPFGGVTIDMPNLISVGNFTPNGVPRIQEISALSSCCYMPCLTTVNGVFAPTNLSITFSLDMPCLTTVVGNFSPFNLNNITNLTFPSMNITGCFTANSIPNLTLMNFPCLTTVNGVFAPTNLSLMTNISMPCLTNVTSNFTPFNLNNITNLTFQSLFVTGCITANSIPNLTLMNFPCLTMINGNVLLSNLALVNSILVPALSSITQALSINNFPNMTLLNFPMLANLNGGLFLSNMSNLTNVTLSNIVNIRNRFAVNLTSNTGCVTNFTLGTTLKRIDGEVNITSANLSQTDVDDLLIRLAALDGTNSTTRYEYRNITITGYSQSPSANGIAACATLLTRGCRVKTNSNGPDLYYPSVSTLLHFDGADASTTFTNNSIYNLTYTRVNNATISTTQSKFGGAAGRFDGSSYITVSSADIFSVGLGDFTVECWVYFNSTAGTIVPICQSDAVGVSTNNKWWIGLTSNTLRIGQHSTGNGASCPWTPSTGVWYHIAVQRRAGVIAMYIDGNSQTVTNSTIFASTSFSQNGFSIGAISTPYYLNGFIDDFRLTLYVGRYSSNFTISSAFPDS